MKILFVSGALSEKLQMELFKQGVPYGFAVQKFYKMLIEGFQENNVSLEILSMVPVPQTKMPYRFKRFKKENTKGVKFRYIPFIRLSSIYHAFILLYVFLYVFLWCIRNRKNSYVLYDVLIPSRCIGTIVGTVLGRGKSVAVVTDMPGMSGEHQVKIEEMGVLTKLQMKSIYKSSAFVLLTEQMNDVLNPYNRPYIIMEGLVPSHLMIRSTAKNKTRDILYAGGILQSYGLGCLCEAFMKLEQKDIRLIIYGDGPDVPLIKEYSNKDKRIEYRGVALNDDVFIAEQESTLLVNPRFSGADYTLFSFPSKNIEYMVSGTPIVTTKLAGIPNEYDPYIYYFDVENVGGYSNTLNSILHLPTKELQEKGQKAQEFILKNKNSTIQVSRIISLIDSYL